MKRLLISVLFLLFSIKSEAFLKIGLIDTGYNLDENKVHLCKIGHYDFTTDKAGVGPDNIGHGSKMLMLITDNIFHDDYCIIVYKVINIPKDSQNVIGNIIKAVYQAIDDKVDIINFSINGADSNEEEYDAMDMALNNNIKIFAAAGNDGKKLGDVCKAYPTCYKKRGLPLTIVGALENGRIAPYSNYGKIVDIWEEGHFLNTQGSSNSNAVATGKYVNVLGDY